MRARFSNLSGFLLAGGASRRMGRPKALLEVEGERLIDRQVRLLQVVSRAVVVLGPPDGFGDLGVQVLPDEIAGRGPLGGIYTGLAHTRTEFNLFVACDLPFLEPRFLRFLVERALGSGADATVPESRERRAQPLCAVYRRRALAAVRATLRAGENKVDRFFGRVVHERITWPQLARAGFAPRIFDNINTPEDYEAVSHAFGLR